MPKNQRTVDIVASRLQRFFYRIFMGSSAEAGAGRADLAKVSPGIRFWPTPAVLGKQCAWGLIVNELTENKVQNGKARVRKFLILLGVIGGEVHECKSKAPQAVVRT
jgi:hypothetical protein